MRPVGQTRQVLCRCARWGSVSGTWRVGGKCGGWDALLDPAARNRLTFIGSGDFHHVTGALLSHFTDPLSVVVFDTHPDWDERSPWACCGSWVGASLRQPHIKQIVMVGLGRGDMGGWRVNVGKVAELQTGRAAFYPYDLSVSHGRGTLPPDLPPVPAARFTPRSGGGYDISWTTVSTTTDEALWDTILSHLPTDDIYLSVDKDCLRREWAVTNWEEGSLALDQVTQGIGRLRGAKNLIGVDITGEYSPVRIRDPLFRLLARWDRPALPPVAPTDLARNEQTNLALLSALRGI